MGIQLVSFYLLPGNKSATMPSTKTASFSFAQGERAFQKQPTIFVGDRAAIGKKKRRSTKTVRYYKNIGLGYCTPKRPFMAIMSTKNALGLATCRFVAVF